MKDNNKWNRENMRTLSTRLRNEEANAFILKAQESGFTANELLKTFVRNYIKDNNVDTSGLYKVRIATLTAAIDELKEERDCLRRRAERAEDIVQYMLAH